MIAVIAPAKRARLIGVVRQRRAASARCRGWRSRARACGSRRTAARSPCSGSCAMSTLISSTIVQRRIAWRYASISTSPVSTSTNFIRFRLARLQAVLSRNMYSRARIGLALIRPASGQVCHSLMVVSYCTPGSAHAQAASAICRQRSRALHRSGGPCHRCGESDPSSVVSHRVDEFVRHAHGVVGVLAGDGGVGLAVEIGWVAGRDQGRDLLLLVRFPVDEGLDVRMVDIEARPSWRRGGWCRRS